MLNQKGIAHILFLVILLVVGIGVGLYLIKNPQILKSRANFPGFGSKEPTVTVKTEYQNPFKKETQYVNPFQSYKNPFEVAK